MPRDASNPNLRLALDLTPTPPSSLDPTRFLVRVTDAQGQPVSGATVEVHLAMPGMDMGDDTVTTEADGSGAYAGMGRFTMSGDWRATVTASAGGRSATQGFPLRVK